MSSAWRNALAACAVTMMMGTGASGFDSSAAASAKADPGDPQATYDGRIAFTRIRYGAAGDLASGRFRREPTWAHDFPRAEYNFQKILSELTFIPAFTDQGNLRRLDDPELTMFPIAYMSEPGFWTMNEAEAAGLRNYLRKGGFIIFDDFRGYHFSNLEAQMRRVYPEGVFRKLDASHPIFHSFFEINELDPRSGYYADEGDTEWLGIFEDNDPRKRLIAIANNNHDLGELWEFSDTGYVPVDLSNEAYKFGVNYYMYALTH
ncbi:MAG TPA: DUF4159 domain-containing protein [Vicinamibacterales bacterium]